MKKFMRIAAVVILVLVFCASGLAKIIKPEMFEGQFVQFGLPAWFVLVTGGVELLGAALIAFFKDARRRFGAALLAVTMAVATVLHATHDPIAMAVPALLLMLLAGVVALMSTQKNSEEALSAAQ